MTTHHPLSCGAAARIGAYSDGVEVKSGARWLCTAGIPGLMPDGTLPKEFTAQAEWAWRNVLALLSQADMGVADIVKVNQSLVRREDLPAYAAVRGRVLGEARPASMLSFVAGLPWPEMLIEIEVYAAKG
jgi:enamine deaminase RidA (YjgF/YER057c/UK114 family)